MFLYAFQPQGHLQKSFFVMAKNKEEAISAIKKYIDDHSKEENEYQDDYLSEHSYIGFGSDYYLVSELKENEVVINDND